MCLIKQCKIPPRQELTSIWLDNNSTINKEMQRLCIKPRQGTRALQVVCINSRSSLSNNHNECHLIYRPIRLYRLIRRTNSIRNIHNIPYRSNSSRNLWIHSILIMLHNYSTSLSIRVLRLSLERASMPPVRSTEQHSHNCLHRCRQGHRCLLGLRLYNKCLLGQLCHLLNLPHYHRILMYSILISNSHSRMRYRSLLAHLRRCQ